MVLRPRANLRNRPNRRARAQTKRTDAYLGTSVRAPDKAYLWAAPWLLPTPQAPGPTRARNGRKTRASLRATPCPIQRRARERAEAKTRRTRSIRKNHRRVFAPQRKAPSAPSRARTARRDRWLALAQSIVLLKNLHKLFTWTLLLVTSELNYIINERIKDAS